MSITKTLTFKVIDFNENIYALMYGVEAFNEYKKNQCLLYHYRYWWDFNGQPRRNPTMQPILRNGGKPR